MDQAKAPAKAAAAARSGIGSTCGLDRQSVGVTGACFDADCQDEIDWSTCGYLSNIGQCALMNTLATFDVFVPCEATCGACRLRELNKTKVGLKEHCSIVSGCGDSKLELCWIIQRIYMPTCLGFGQQCRRSCLICNLPGFGK